MKKFIISSCLMKRNILLKIVSLLCLGLSFVPCKTIAKDVPVAILSDKNGEYTLTFTYKDSMYIGSNGVYYALHQSKKGVPDWIPTDTAGLALWTSEKGYQYVTRYVYGNDSLHYTRRVTTVVFEKAFAKARPKSTSGWFFGMTRLKNIKGLENLNTSEVTNMTNMFYYCCGLRELDLSSFRTCNVTDMSWMFALCYRLRKLNVRNFSTGRVKNIRSMFRSTFNLDSLDISSFNLKGIEDPANITFMFCGFDHLKYFNVGDNDFSKSSFGSVALDTVAFKGAGYKDKYGGIWCCPLIVESNFNRSVLQEIKGYTEPVYKWRGGYFDPRDGNPKPTISWTQSTASVVIGDSAVFEAKSSNGKPISYYIHNVKGAVKSYVADGKLIVKSTKAGTVTIHAMLPADNESAAVTTSIDLTIDKAPISIIWDEHQDTIVYTNRQIVISARAFSKFGERMVTFGISDGVSIIHGSVKKEYINQDIGEAWVLEGKKPGKVTVYARSHGDEDRESDTSQPKVFTVLKLKEQTLSWTRQTAGMTIGDSCVFEAKSSASIPVKYEIIQGADLVLATLQDSTISLKALKPGAVTLLARTDDRGYNYGYERCYITISKKNKTSHGSRTRQL